MFANDTSQNTSNKVTNTVQKVLLRSINEASDWCDNNAMILHPAKPKSMLLAARQKHRLRPHYLVMKTVVLKKFNGTGTLAFLVMMSSAGDHTLLAHVKQY